MLLFLTLESPAAAQLQRSISADRPGLSYSATALPRGAVQIEVGAPTLRRDALGETDLRSTSFPTAVRVGVGDQVELRLESPVYHIRRYDEGGIEDVEGMGDVALGAKIALPVWDPFFVTNVALMPRVTIPVGEAPFTADGVAAELNALGGWLGWWTLSFRTLSGIALRPVEGVHRLGGQFVVTMSYSPLSALSLFSEAGYYPTAGTRDPLYAGGGLTLLITPGVQLDAYFDAGLTEAATDLLYGLGLSVRIN